MKMILKVLALPVLLILKLMWVIVNLFSHLSSYVAAPLMLVILGCGIFCITQTKWTELAILAVMELTVFMALFFTHRRTGSSPHKVNSSRFGACGSFALRSTQSFAFSFSTSNTDGRSSFPNAFERSTLLRS